MGIIEVLRQYRVGSFTIFDTALAYGAVFFLAPLFSKLFIKINIQISRGSWMWLTLPIGVIFHVIFHQNTPFTRMFLDMNGFYIEKLVLLFMIYMGFRSIKRINPQSINPPVSE